MSLHQKTQGYPHRIFLSENFRTEKPGADRSAVRCPVHYTEIRSAPNRIVCRPAVRGWSPGSFRKVCQTFKHKTVRQPDLHQCLRVQRIYDHAGDSAAVFFAFPGPHRPEDRYRMSRDRTRYVFVCAGNRLFNISMTVSSISFASSRNRMRRSSALI